MLNRNEIEFESTIKIRTHNLVEKNNYIELYLKGGNSVPEKLNDNQFTIFHVIDSINYIPEVLREEDKLYIDLIIDNTSEQRMAIDQNTGMGAVLYCWATGKYSFAKYVEHKEFELIHFNITTEGEQILYRTLKGALSYSNKDTIKNILPFIPNYIIIANNQEIATKFSNGLFSGNNLEILNLLISKGFEVDTPTKRGFNIFQYALVNRKNELLDFFKKEYINQKDNEGNNILQFVLENPYSSDFSTTFLPNVKSILNYPEFDTHSTNNKKQSVLHTLASLSSDPDDSKDIIDLRIKNYIEIYHLILSNTRKIDFTDHQGNNILHYMAGYPLLNFEKDLIKKKWFYNHEFEQEWRTPIIQDLIQKGIDPYEKNNDGFSAIDVSKLASLSLFSDNFELYISELTTEIQSDEDLFWLEEYAPSDYLKEIKSKNQLATLFDLFIYNENDFFKNGEMDFPTALLSYSNMFFGDNDAGNMPYELQIQLVNKKHKELTKEISALLKQEPEKELIIPNTRNYSDDEYFELIENNPFAYYFEFPFEMWHQENKLLFLGVQKEDAELPYLIELGIVPLNWYKSLLLKFNK